MNTGKETEDYVKDWCQEKKRKFLKKHGKGHDLKMEDKDGDIFIEVKGSTNKEFNKPYITKNELEQAVDKGKRYEFHIILGFKDKKPKEHGHYIFSGQDLQDLIGYEELKNFIDEGNNFLDKWSKSKMFKTLKPEISVYLKENIGKEADDYIKEKG